MHYVLSAAAAAASIPGMSDIGNPRPDVILSCIASAAWNSVMSYPVLSCTSPSCTATAEGHREAGRQAQMLLTDHGMAWSDGRSLAQSPVV